MYLTAVPEGETVGGGGGNSKTWVVSATSVDMLKWDVDPLVVIEDPSGADWTCLLYTSPSPRDLSTARMPSSA